MPAQCLEIDAEHPLVRERADALVRSTYSSAEAARALFEYVRDEIAYTFRWQEGPADAWPPTAVFRASTTLARGTGMCIQKAVLLCALARAAGLTARISFQSVRDYRLPRELVALMGDVLTPHGLTTIRINRRAVRLDPSLDRNLCERKGYRLTEFSARKHALLPAVDTAGNPHFEILEELGEFDVFPMDLVMARFEARFRDLDVAAVRAYIERTAATM